MSIKCGCNQNPEHRKFVKLCLNERTGAKASLSQVEVAHRIPVILGWRLNHLTRGAGLKEAVGSGRWGYQVVMGALAGWVENSSESGASWRQRLLGPTGIYRAVANSWLWDSRMTCLAICLYVIQRPNPVKGRPGRRELSELEGPFPKVKLMATQSSSCLMNGWPPQESESGSMKGACGCPGSTSVTRLERSREPGLENQTSWHLYDSSCVWLPQFTFFQVCFHGD